MQLLPQPTTSAGGIPARISMKDKKIRPELDGIKRQEQSPIKQALPILFWMIVFTVVFALFIRVFMMKLGIVI